MRETPPVSVSVLSRRDFDRLLKPIHAALYGFAVKLVGKRDADDCLQTGLLLGWNKISRLASNPLSQDLLRFLIPCVRQACRQRRRELAREIVDYFPPEALLPYLEQLSLHPDWELPDLSAAYYDFTRDQILGLLQRAALTALQETCIRQMLNGLNQSQIARHLSISQPAVFDHLQAASRKLAHAKYWNEEPEDWIVRFFWEQVEQIKRSIPQKRSKSRPVQKVQQRKRTASGQNTREFAGATRLPQQQGEH